MINSLAIISVVLELLMTDGFVSESVSSLRVENGFGLQVNKTSKLRA